MPKVRAADNALSILPRTRMMVKGFKIDLWISLWDSQTGGIQVGIVEWRRRPDGKEKE